jgi:hypothetical protein
MTAAAMALIRPDSPVGPSKKFVPVKGSIEARSQEVARLVSERKAVFDGIVAAEANGEVPAASEWRRWSELTQEIDKVFRGGQIGGLQKNT